MRRLANTGFIYDAQPFDPPSADSVAVCSEWIRSHCKKTICIVRSESSYGLKHRVEHDHPDAGWIGNGEFIAAATALGFRCVPTDKDSPNAFFNMTCGGVHGSWCEICRESVTLTTGVAFGLGEATAVGTFSIRRLDYLCLSCLGGAEGGIHVDQSTWPISFPLAMFTESPLRLLAWAFAHCEWQSNAREAFNVWLSEAQPDLVPDGKRIPRTPPEFSTRGGRAQEAAYLQWLRAGSVDGDVF